MDASSSIAGELKGTFDGGMNLERLMTMEEEQEKITKDLEKIPKKIAEIYPLIVLVDDSQFVAHKFSNFLWVTFTRSNPSHDVYGVGSFIKFKHWGCEGSLVVDARIKPHHAPPLLEDPQVEEKVDRMMRKIGF